jgi:hypothetical protein
MVTSDDEIIVEEGEKEQGEEKEKEKEEGASFEGRCPVYH